MGDIYLFGSRKLCTNICIDTLYTLRHNVPDFVLVLPGKTDIFNLWVQPHALIKHDCRIRNRSHTSIQTVHLLVFCRRLSTTIILNFHLYHNGRSVGMSYPDFITTLSI